MVDPGRESMNSANPVSSFIFRLACCAAWAGTLSACSHEGSGHPLPCSQVGIAKCGTQCANDIDCGTGLYCDSGTSLCTANCSSGATTCASDQVCDATGRCVNPNNPNGGNPDLSATVPCPAGLMCNVSCSNGGSTTISGKVYDPAMKNPLYGVSVYVPANPLVALPKGVPTGSDACSCGALYQSGAVASTSTAEDGSFTLPNAPVGSAVPLVIQVGKWRRKYTLNITSCQDNPQADKSLAFLGTIPAGDTDDNLPDIAVSTGHADTLECLMQRIGIPASEYVNGAAGTGHVHVFSGGQPGGGSGGIGGPEQNGMSNVASYQNLWASQDQLMPYDILLLSCEGGETYNAKPDVLEAYLNAGGRAFSSHFHYAWFAGPLQTMQSYSAPMDWGTNLAAWTGGGGMSNGPIGGSIVTTLNGSMMPFPKGVSLQKWLTNVNALGKNGVPMSELSIYDPRYNAVVGTSNTASQPWILADAMAGSADKGHTMYFSFDTPVNAAAGADGGAPNYCGRAVFSDLHIGAAVNDQPPTCKQQDLSPQEKALEFMLFDLSACVVSDTVAPPVGVPVIIK
jgi:hypothetical protein